MTRRRATRMSSKPAMASISGTVHPDGEAQAMPAADAVDHAIDGDRVPAFGET